MKKLLLSLTIITILSVFFATIAIAAPGGVNDPDVLKGLATVRRATVKYHDVDKAMNDGYVFPPDPEAECVAVPGLGGMGVHVVNFGLAGDNTVDAQTPEVLLYQPTNSGLKLIGVEYVMFSEELPEPPTVLGQEMNFSEHPPLPSHYELHVWLWQANPAGIFADFNPNVSCP